MELEPGIHQLTIGREPFPGFPTPNSFLVFGADASVLIDMGWENDDDHRARVDYLREVNAPPVSEIIITHRHPDHGGGALHMHRETGAPLSCHPNDREVIERDRLHGEIEVSTELQGGERRELGGLSIDVVFAPGHTSGSLALYVPERSAIFTSDTVMGVSTTAINPRDGSLAQYMQTLDLFKEMGARVMYTGHGAPIKDPAGRLDALIVHRQEREAAILKELADGPLTPADLRARIYVNLPQARESLAERQILTTLVKLIDDQAVVSEEDDRYALR